MEEVDYSNLACLKLLNDTLLPAWSGSDPDYKMIGLINWISFRSPLKAPFFMLKTQNTLTVKRDLSSFYLK
ncbi:MAG: hypothetical protein ABI543_00095 [Ignavibacteria bacterium]